MWGEDALCANLGRCLDTEAPGTDQGSGQHRPGRGAAEAKWRRAGSRLPPPTQLFPAAFCVVQEKGTRDSRPFEVRLLGLCRLCLPARLALFGACLTLSAPAANRLDPRTRVLNAWVCICPLRWLLRRPFMLPLPTLTPACVGMSPALSSSGIPET